MNYSNAVAEIRRLGKVIEKAETTAEQAKWDRARLAVEAGRTAQQLAADIGVAVSTIDRWRAIWKRFSPLPVGERPTFAEATEITTGRQEKSEEEGSRYQHEARQAVRNMPPERKAEVVREALADPDVATRVLRDSHTRRVVSDARQRIVEEIEGAARDRVRADPDLRATHEAALALEIEKDISMARFRLAEATRKLQDLQDREQGTMAALDRAAQEVEDALGWLRTVIRGGRVDDEALARLLDGE